MHKFKLFLLFFIGFYATSYAQVKKMGVVKGVLINSETKKPLKDAEVTIQGLDKKAISGKSGIFVITKIPYGKYKLIISVDNAERNSIDVTVDRNYQDVGEIKVLPVSPITTETTPLAAEQADSIPIIRVDANDGGADLEGDNTGEANGLMVSRDPFVSAVTFTLGRYGFQPRGYGRSQQSILVNGVNLNELTTTSSTSTWNSFGGLNEEFRDRTVTYGLAPSEYAFGGINGTINIKATAADQRKGSSVNYTFGDGNYISKISLTTNSGLMKNGWAYSLSVAKRWSDGGYRPGVFYDGYSYYGSLSKVIKKSEFSLTTFGTPTNRGRSSATTQEAYDLTGSHYYNPNWGYQDGKERNARVQNIFIPVTTLNYQYKPSDRTIWNAAVGYEFGKNKNSTIDYYNGYDPRPDYYRNLPSYYENTVPPNLGAAAAVKQQIISNPQQMQIDWNRLYNVNYGNKETITDVNGVAGNDVTGKRSVYVMSDYVTDVKKWNFNGNLQHSLNKHITLYTGITALLERIENYKQLTDLMGGDFFVNYNQFASQQYVGNPQFNQNDLNNPNALIKVGDKYGYDYINHYTNANWWGQAIFTYGKLEFFASATAGTTSFNRDGLMKNGLFPDNSYGTSPSQNFFTYGVKGGATYNIDRKNLLFVNATYNTTPPSINNTYIAGTIRDLTVNNPTVQINEGLEGGYLLRSSAVKARIVGYVTDVKDATMISRFYNDDPAYYTFVNYVMQNVNARFIGTELALDVKVWNNISVIGAASLGEAFYTNHPNVSVYKDNDTSKTTGTRSVYIKNYYLGVGPQSVYTAGIKYSGKFYGDISFNYFDRNYVAINPDRRTQQATDLVAPNSELWHQIVDQEKLPAYFTVDMHLGKNFNLSRVSGAVKKLSENTILNLSAGVRNLLNNKDIIAFGYEQLRYDYIDRNPDKFPNKCYYGPGINFYISAGLKF